MMDREQEELQFMSFYGTFKEAFKIICSWTKIFSQITIALILPLSFIFLAHIQISDILFAKILTNEQALDYTRSGSPMYNRIADRLSSEWTVYWLFKGTYLLFVLVFSLLSTSAVVYTIASIYTGKGISFRKVMSVVPKVWKRLMVTFLCNFIIILGYNIVSLLVFVLWFLIMAPTIIGVVFLVILFVVYLVGFVYISVIWHLASVVSVLEDKYGIQAMVKSNALIKGKMLLGSAIFVMFQFTLVVIQIAFENLVVQDESLGRRVSYGIMCFVLLMMLILIGLAAQTIVYFICKSFHHENIDKSVLSEHLEVYAGEYYVPLKGRDVQMEQISGI
ncbi:hypothetical protein Sjap_018417 [Stephania japonica]|uniref:Polyadenylate-binding protein 1-B-binding protein n=1 Tax=Stephania japonica TaxID=461633 RepID=A0AAP0I7Y6_9MAGN